MPNEYKLTPYRIGNKTRRAMLLQEVQNLECEIENAEMRIPEALKELKRLKPTKKELEENGLQELFDTYL
jgi:hypothetical protein